MGQMHGRRLFFPVRGGGGGKGVGRGYKGKGGLLHALTDGNGAVLCVRITPANGDERQQIIPMLKHIKQRHQRVPKRLYADRGYDADWLRYKLSWLLGMATSIPYRSYDPQRKGQYRKPVESVESPRWKVERTFAWLYKKYRRLTQRYERNKHIFNAFAQAAVAHFWLNLLTM